MTTGVTVVVATYNRPDALRVALRSALAQGPMVVEVLVIGDHCDERTEHVCHALADPRIRYHNLPRRFGEQSGPNSIGMLLARSEFVALLNQDDIWLPGHLESAVEAMRETGSDLFLGRAACATVLSQSPGGEPWPRFTLVHPRTRTFHGCFVHEFWCEPASAWLFGRRLVKAVGVWRPARALYRTPIEDWILRAWRRGMRVAFGSELSVLKITTQYARDADQPAYHAASPEHDRLEAWIARVGAEACRRAVEAEATGPTPTLPGWGKHVRERLRREGIGCVPRVLARRTARVLTRNRFTAKLFEHTGVDAWDVACRLSGQERGAQIASGSLRRTGKALPEPPPLGELLAAIGHRTSSPGR
jgi:hypothetical protein